MLNPRDTEGERRLDLWRRALFLFDRTKRIVGPFYEAGYTGYWCEGRSTDKQTPDIFGFSDNYFCVCDVSMSPQKGEEMYKYQDCVPNEYLTKTLFPSDVARSSCGNPFLITDNLQVEKFPGYNLIQVYQPGSAYIERIDDERLKNVLERWNGFIAPPPNYSLLAVPESDMEELKFPICGIMKWVADQGTPVKIETIVEKLLGNLYSSFSKSSRAQLRGNVEKILYDLRKGPLSEYLEYDSKSKSVFINLDTSAAPSKKAFSDKLNVWLNVVPIEKFPEIDMDEDDV